MIDPKEQEAPSLTTLSEREYEVFGYIIQGMTYRQIAQKLGISIKSVGGRAKDAFIKLRVNNKNEALNKYSSNWSQYYRK